MCKKGMYTYKMGVAQVCKVSVVVVARVSGSEGDNSKSGRDRECAVLCGVDNGGKGTENGGVAGSGRSVGISWREIGEGGGVGLTLAVGQQGHGPTWESLTTWYCRAS